MQTRYRDPGTTSAITSLDQWKAALELIRTSGGGVEIESDNVVLIPTEEFWRLVAIDEKEMREAAARHYRELEEIASDPDYELTNQQIEDLSVYIGREINAAVAERFFAERAQSEPRESG